MQQNKPLSLKKLTIPIFIDMFLHFATLIINTYMVTKVSVHLVGAMGAGNQVMDLFMTIFSFLSVGCSIVVAQALGAKNKHLAKRVIHASLTFNTLLGLSCAMLIYFFGYKILELLNVPSELRNESFVYLHMLGWALCFDGIGMVMAAILRVYNLATAVMIVSLLMNLITLFGNAIALFGWFDLPNYGLKGVAISTIVGRFIGLIVLFFMIKYLAGVRIYLKRLLALPFEILRKILHVGLPSAGENLLWMAQYMVAFGFVASMGEASLSVQTIYFQISLLIMLCGASMSVANEVIVGHLVGAKQFDDAYKRTFNALKYGIIATAIVVLIMYFSKNFIMLELGLNDELKSIMLPLFTLSIALEIGRTFNIVMVNALRASGDARFPLMTGLIFMWGLSLPLGYYLGIVLNWGIIGVWIGFCADEWVRGLVNTYRWKSRKWESKRLV
ncbi:multidrug transporter MatE [Campylobacter mucosalis]|uniref:MATE family efflux transporter n=1 Tax=Campylobacter mucosalis TaxID=202 RepID=UPI0004DA8211|nr:MATE family efflux transporter [Campylobacter mucosalis]KEA45464.1 multidrug transporter MatE [Campylobacter mucosalis]QKF63369.1 MATE family efflux protein [Campylobacter mucosalis]